jgi:general secretion pathway protein G
MKKGFTLIELMVVIAIIGILGVVITPVVGKAIQKAKAAKAIAAIGSVTLACEMYYMDTGQYAEEYSFSAGPTYHRLSTDPTVTGWDGPYIKAPFTPSTNPFDGLTSVFSNLDWSHISSIPDGFDLDSDGTVDTDGLGNFLLFSNVPQTLAERIDNALDATNGAANWNARGQVKFQIPPTTPNPNYMHVYLTGGD